MNVIDMKKVTEFADYTLSCRTCLAVDSDAELVHLSEPIEENKTITHMDYLISCMQVDDMPGMPTIICAKCSLALKVSFSFMENARRAQEILKSKLQEMNKINHMMRQRGINESEQQCLLAKGKKLKCYRCKVCDLKLEGRRSLKEHVKLHLDLIIYECQLCTYESHESLSLSEHYQLKHDTKATAEQLKPKAIILKPQKNSSIKLKENSECRDTLAEKDSMSSVIGTNKIHTNPKEKILTETKCILRNDVLKQANVDNTIDQDVSAKMRKTGSFSSSYKNDTTQMDVDDLIIEENVNSSEETLEYAVTCDKYVAVDAIKMFKNVKCKICFDSFSTQFELKAHMLSHSGIPHFFCDTCTFYTFFKMDLCQHYRNKHNIQPTNIQLQPKNKQSKEILQSKKEEMKHLYTCDLCLFESADKLVLKRHYFENHQIPVKEIHLRPVVVDDDSEMADIRLCPAVSTTSTSSKVVAAQDKQSPNASTIKTDQVYSFDFNNGTLFEDFNDDGETELADNDEKIDLCELQLQLTSDDDLEDEVVLQKEDDPIQKHSLSFCVHCQKNILTQYKFENHMFIHRGLAPYRCEMCTNLYNLKEALIRHYKVVHKTTPTRDMIQAKGGDTMKDDERIIDYKDLKASNDVTLMCAKCPFESRNLSNLRLHLKSVHDSTDDGRFLYNKNHICFDGFLILLLHSQELPFECPRCVRSFSSKTKLLHHLQHNHSKTSILQLQKQNINLESRCGFRKHHEFEISTTTTSSTMKKVSLPTATATAVRKEENISEIKSTMTALNKKYNDKTTASEDEVVALFKCKICRMSCYTIDSFDKHSRHLKCHLQDTNDARPFECEICHCSYKTLYSLKRHFKRHLSRKFRCLQCPKTYISKQELKIHQYMHSGEKPHQCDLCPKKFRYIHHLKRHKDAAHFDKRYSCSIENCCRTFTTLAQLKIHVWQHSGITPYKCTYCARLFKRREPLRQHCRKSHNITLTEEEIAEIFRKSLGYTNPHDFTVAVSGGKLFRRGDLESNAILYI
uniref:Protein krueppel n=1 Tax=Glossina brevipalpis TaxID=37001 RepID=A0A1A9WWV2_9MUSC